jgi:hypothetical protein
VPCKFCYGSVCPEVHHRCLRDVAPDEVVTATLDLLAEVRLSSRRPAERNGRAREMTGVAGIQVARMRGA